MRADRDSVRDVLAKFPTGVTVVTTVDPEGKRWGFTATSFTAVSLRPPVVLVCLDRSARCHPAFAAAEAFAVHILAAGQEDVAQMFGQHERDKFAPFDFGEGVRGIPVLRNALAVLECVLESRVEVGDHTILLGGVINTSVRAGEPALYFDRAFRNIASY